MTFLSAINCSGVLGVGEGGICCLEFDGIGLGENTPILVSLQDTIAMIAIAKVIPKRR